METFAILLTLTSAIIALFIPALLYPRRFMRWFKLKRYQYEVTFSLYMLTPAEKFILNSFVFLTLSMIIIAASLYLPEHIITMSHRAFYYWSGYTRAASAHSSTVASAASASLSNFAGKVVDSGKNIAIDVAKSAVTRATHVDERILERMVTPTAVLVER